MAGTKSGGIKNNETMLKKFNGDAQALKKWRQEIGAKGGRGSNTGGFAARPDLAIEAGRKGGRISRRGKSNIDPNFEASL